MRARNEMVFRVRRFRVAMVAIVAFPWLVSLLLTPFFGWYGSLGWTVARLVVDVLLVAFAWRNPAGLAAVWIIIRLIAGAMLIVFLFNRSFACVAIATVEVLEALLLLWLLVPMWSELQRIRMQDQLTRIDEVYARADRRASLRRHAQLERQG